MIALLKDAWGRVLGRPRKFAAVDFDARRVRVIVAEPVTTGTRITQAVSLELPEGGDVTDPQEFGRFLAQRLRDMHLRGGGVVMNVPRSQAVLKPLSLPPGTSREEMPGMVHYQVGKELPFPVEDAVIDFTTETHGSVEALSSTETDEDTKGQQEVPVMVGAIRLGVVDYYRQICESAGVKLLALGLRPYSNMHCVEVSDKFAGQDPVAVVQITADETEIDLVAHNTLVFSRSAVKDISVPPGADQEAKVRMVASLATEVARTLQSYQALERGTRLAGVLLAGETSLEQQVGDAISARLSVPCEVFQPSQVFQDTVREQITSGFISGLGLAVDYATDRQLTFDFVNPKRPPVKRDPRKARALAIVGATAVLLLVAIIARAVVVGSKQTQVNSLLARERQLDEAIKLAKTKAKQVDTIEEWIESSQDWLTQWAHLSCLLPSAKDVYLTNFKIGGDRSITFGVRAASSEAINLLNKQLGEAGYDFRPGQVKRGNPLYECPYSTTLRVQASATAETDLATTRFVPRPDDDCTPEQFVKTLAPRGRSRSRAPARPTRVTRRARR